MRVRLLLILTAFIMALCVWAETPKECYQKHPKAMCMFFNTPKFDGTLDGFEIERIAIYPVKQTVAIKTTQRAKDVVKNIKDMWHEDDGMLCIVFTDDSGLAFDKNKLSLIYLSTKKEKAYFMLDEYRQKMYEDMIGSYNFEGM